MRNAARAMTSRGCNSGLLTSECRIFRMRRLPSRSKKTAPLAEVVKLVDTHVSGTCEATRGGSSPLLGTICKALPPYFSIACQLGFRRLLERYVTFVRPLASLTPSYLTQNRLGIFIFQFRFPRRLRDRFPSLPVLFRRSLGVRSRREALPLSRRWMSLMDELERRFFDSPDRYAGAIRLLGRYQNIESSSWAEVEPVLMELERLGAPPKNANV